MTSSEAATRPDDSIPAALRRRWQRWLDRRIPPSSTVTLNQRRIFIFPSATGFFFGLALLLMLVAGINYQNNTAYALTFLLANLFVVAVLHSYANLSGLTLTAVGAEDAFPGQRAAFRLRLRCDNRRGHFGLKLGWALPAEERRRRRFLRGLFSSPEMLAEARVDLEPGAQQECVLYLPVGGRGWYRPGRLRLESVYPLGLLRCWTWVDLDLRALVYPEPRAAGDLRSDGEEGAEGHQVGGSGDDEFFGLRDYRDGDSPRRVYWKGLARGQELQSKEFAAAVSDERWLDWQQFPGLGVEQRLSALCFWVLAFEAREQEYGLRIPGTELAPGCGERQREQALRALALFGLENGLDDGRGTAP